MGSSLNFLNILHLPLFELQVRTWTGWTLLPDVSEFTQYKISQLSSSMFSSLQKCFFIYWHKCFPLGTRRHRHRIASSGRRVAPPWPRRMACLSVSRGWQEQIQYRCRVGLSSAHEDDQDDRQSPILPSERLDARPTWQCRGLCAGVPWVSRAM